MEVVIKTKVVTEMEEKIVMDKKNCVNVFIKKICYWMFEFQDFVQTSASFSMQCLGTLLEHEP